MNPNFTPKERELVKLVTYFKKKAERNELNIEGHVEMMNACEVLLEKLEIVANRREEIHQNRQRLMTILQDNAVCPNCGRNTHLKKTGVTEEDGMKFNAYTCKRCNIRFDWGTPNNPWDLLTYMQQNKAKMEETGDTAENNPNIRELEMNINTLAPILEASDLEFNEMSKAVEEMDKLVSSFKKQLMIEKIKLED